MDADDRLEVGGPRLLEEAQLPDAVRQQHGAVGVQGRQAAQRAFDEGGRQVLGGGPVQAAQVADDEAAAVGFDPGHALVGGPGVEAAGRQVGEDLLAGAHVDGQAGRPGYVRGRSGGLREDPGGGVAAFGRSVAAGGEADHFHDGVAAGEGAQPGAEVDGAVLGEGQGLVQGEVRHGAVGGPVDGVLECEGQLQVAAEGEDRFSQGGAAVQAGGLRGGDAGGELPGSVGRGGLGLLAQQRVVGCGGGGGAAEAVPGGR
ncbi:hypothetical protein GCM10020000_70810 [Streptomyces olivoverticillatus]